MPLVDLKHDVVSFDYDLTPHFLHLDPSEPHKRAFIVANRHKLEAALLRQIEAAHREKPIDVFFSYFYNACATPETIRAIADMGITTVNWFCNAAYQFHLVSEIAPAYHFSLVPEVYRLDDYRRVGANPIYCQMAANPSIYHPHDVPLEFDVVFVGQKYGDRPTYIRRLLDAGIPTRVWGPGWLPPTTTMTTSEIWRNRLRLLTTPAGWSAILRQLSPAPAIPTGERVNVPPSICGPALDDDALIEMYSRARIHLGFSSVGETHASGERILQVRLRDFEAPMSGAFYMVEYMPELETFYDVQKEVVCYRSADDLVEKARYYLDHADEREEIRQAGLARAMRDHTWHRRFEVAFAEMGFK
ncbi:MAG: hypothetical protein EPO26_15085 [Chloroflexota bacterium]|nr:MAG: hypothetical protein EPO26_15085 [Chloroflexota bacterium]